MALTDAKIRAAKPGPKIMKLSDGRGLQLWVAPTGAKYWRLGYRHSGKQKALAIGVYPKVSLADARAACQRAHDLLDAGRDPVAAKHVEKAMKAISSANTFDAVASELYEKKKAEAKADKTLVKFEWFSRLARPALAARPIKDITAAEILAVLKPIEARGNHETAKKMRGFVGQVFRYAIATGRAENDPTIALRGALIPPKVTPRAAILDPKRFGALLRAVDGYTGSPETRAALQLLALTFVRPGELRAATWQEFDFDNAIWSIPADRMKMRLPHRVPLAAQAVAILKELRAISRTTLLFPGQRDSKRPVSENTLNAALRALGFSGNEMTAHGFRAAASSILNGSRLFHPDAIERQLAHIEQNAVRRAYDRSDHWDERVRLMQWWADRCDAMRAAKQ